MRRASRSITLALIGSAFLVPACDNAPAPQSPPIPAPPGYAADGRPFPGGYASTQPGYNDRNYWDSRTSTGWHGGAYYRNGVRFSEPDDPSTYHGGAAGARSSFHGNPGFQGGEATHEGGAFHGTGRGGFGATGHAGHGGGGE